MTTKQQLFGIRFIVEIFFYFDISIIHLQLQITLFLNKQINSESLNTERTDGYG